MEVISTLGVLLRAGLGSYSLILAVAKASRAMEVMIRLNEGPVESVYAAATITGLPALFALLGCLGLGLVFLSLACGITLGAWAMMLVMSRRVGSGVAMGLTGLTLALGPGIGGAILGHALTIVLMMGPIGMCLMGVLLSLSLFPMRKQIKKNIVITETGLLIVFLTLTFMTMLLGVWLGNVMPGVDRREADIILILILFSAIVLLPAARGLSFLAEMVLGKLSTVAFPWVLYGWSVAMAGMLFGLNLGSHATGRLQYETAMVLQSLVHTTALLAGLVGSVLGAVSVSSLEAGMVGGVSVWISIMVAVVLNISDWYLGAGGTVGLLLGMAGAAGVSLGAAGVSTAKQYSGKGFLLEAFGSVICSTVFGESSVTFQNVATALAATIAPKLVMERVRGAEDLVRARRRNGHEMMAVATLSSAALGMVAMGSMVLGAAGLFTAQLGSAGSCGVLLAAVITIIKTENLYFNRDVHR